MFIDCADKTQKITLKMTIGHYFKNFVVIEQKLMKVRYNFHLFCLFTVVVYRMFRKVIKILKIRYDNFKDRFKERAYFLSKLRKGLRLSFDFVDI